MLDGDESNGFGRGFGKVVVGGDGNVEVRILGLICDVLEILEE